MEDRGRRALGHDAKDEGIEVVEETSRQMLVEPRAVLVAMKKRAPGRRRWRLHRIRRERRGRQRHWRQRSAADVLERGSARRVQRLNHVRVIAPHDERRV
jgi:hypothetical protein